MARMKIRVLFATSELTPIAKVGGLGDVAGALPPALATRGADVRVILPRYEPIDAEKFPMKRIAKGVPVRRGPHVDHVDILQGVIPNSKVPVYYLENKEFLSSFGIYFERSAFVGTFAEIQRFLFFSLAVAQVLPALKWRPHIVHAQDWHTGLLPWLLSQLAPAAPKTLYTIHNLANQGRWNPRDVIGFLGHGETGALSRRDRGGDFNLMLEGIVGADRVNTVSPTYAREILTPEYGEGLQGVLAERKSVLSGILNGIDVHRFNPETDPDIAVRYSAADLRGKAACKASLQKELRLAGDPTAPLLGMVTRLTNQKGMELVAAADAVLTEYQAQLVILGQGAPNEERLANDLATRHPDRVRLTLGFDAELAQRIYAGSDLFLMPSRFEPCGLGQMIAMRYGSVPVVRATGGLADTVPDLNGKPESGLGFAFEPYNAEVFRQTLSRALAAFRSGAHWRTVVERDMAQDFSWERSAGEYLALYRTLIG
jgi:starch synthase